MQMSPELYSADARPLLPSFSSIMEQKKSSTDPSTEKSNQANLLLREQQVLVSSIPTHLQQQSTQDPSSASNQTSISQTSAGAKDTNPAGSCMPSPVAMQMQMQMPMQMSMGMPMSMPMTMQMPMGMQMQMPMAMQMPMQLPMQMPMQMPMGVGMPMQMSISMPMGMPMGMPMSIPMQIQMAPHSSASTEIHNHATESQPQHHVGYMTVVPGQVQTMMDQKHAKAIEASTQRQYTMSQNTPPSCPSEGPARNDKFIDRPPAENDYPSMGSRSSGGFVNCPDGETCTDSDDGHISVPQRPKKKRAHQQLKGSLGKKETKPATFKDISILQGGLPPAIQEIIEATPELLEMRQKVLQQPLQFGIPVSRRNPTIMSIIINYVMQLKRRNKSWNQKNAIGITKKPNKPKSKGNDSEELEEDIRTIIAQGKPCKTYSAEFDLDGSGTNYDSDA